MPDVPAAADFASARAPEGTLLDAAQQKAPVVQPRKSLLFTWTPATQLTARQRQNKTDLWAMQMMVMLNGEIAQLLNHPLRLRVLGDVAQQEAPPAQLHKEQNVERPQSSGGDGEEIGGPDKVFVLAEKLRPAW